MGNLLGSLVRGNQKQTILCHWKWVVTCRKPFAKTLRASFPLELVRSNTCKPMNVKACHGTSYFLTFIDDCVRFSYVYLISYRFKALDSSSAL
jgi:hypothetical protein